MRERERKLIHLISDHIWKPIRKAVNPAFSQRMSLSFVPIFEKYYEQFCKEIHGFEGKTFDIYDGLVRYGMQIIFETNFGFQDAQNEFNGDIFENYLENLYSRCANPWMHFDFLYNRTSLAQKDHEIDETFKKLFRKVVQKREINSSARLFIDEMLKYVEENNFKNDDALIENMAIVFMAGYETTAVAIGMTVLLLAMHPEVDEKLEKELFEHYVPGEAIDQELLRKLPYLDKVVKESMRLFPPVPVVMKQNLHSTNVGKLFLNNKFFKKIHLKLF